MLNLNSKSKEEQTIKEDKLQVVRGFFKRNTVVGLRSLAHASSARSEDRRAITRERNPLTRSTVPCWKKRGRVLYSPSRGRETTVPAREGDAGPSQGGGIVGRGGEAEVAV